MAQKNRSSTDNLASKQHEYRIGSTGGTSNQIDVRFNINIKFDGDVTLTKSTATTESRLTKALLKGKTKLLRNHSRASVQDEAVF